jgi:hypothetical protein
MRRRVRRVRRGALLARNESAKEGVRFAVMVGVSWLLLSLAVLAVFAGQMLCFGLAMKCLSDDNPRVAPAPDFP